MPWCEFIWCVSMSAVADEKARFSGSFAVKREKTWVTRGVDSGYLHRSFNRLDLPLLRALRTIQCAFSKKGLPLKMVETQPKYSKVVYSSQEFSTRYKIVIIKLLFNETVWNAECAEAFHSGHRGNSLQIERKNLLGKVAIIGGFCVFDNVFGLKIHTLATNEKGIYFNTKIFLRAAQSAIEQGARTNRHQGAAASSTRTFLKRFLLAVVSPGRILVIGMHPKF